MLAMTSCAVVAVPSPLVLLMMPLAGIWAMVGQAGYARSGMTKVGDLYRRLDRYNGGDPYQRIMWCCAYSAITRHASPSDWDKIRDAAQ